ncbi:hypothetical protein CBD41_10125 [bacterium TMED181]|nr:hypothetical protein [Planctomycetota bacterium]OUW41753.1 MAG: hypothetical protein CBD41_10125 [bacterium TMED181]
MTRKSLWFLFLLLCGCQTAWIASNAGGVVSRMAGSKTPEELLSSPGLPERWRSALVELPSLLQFARDSGLSVGGAYQRIDIEENPVSYIVVAANREDLALFHWDFPVVGSAPYKGFRFIQHAELERKRLERMGLEVEIYPVSAFSSLGWFSETLPGGVLSLPESQRVRTIFHELVHRTIFVSGRADLNESLANYFGNELSRKWFLLKGGEESSALLVIEREIHDEELLRSHLLELQKNWTSETLKADLESFSGVLQQESWMSQMGQQNSVRNWTLPTILMWQVYDAGAWPWPELWQSCDQDFQVLKWRIRQDFSGTP